MVLKCGHSDKTEWLEMAPDFYQQYKVICRTCGKMHAWGSPRTLNEGRSATRDIVVTPYRSPSIGPTLEAFLDQ